MAFDFAGIFNWNWLGTQKDVPLGDVMEERGVSGTASYGGFLAINERNAKLVGQNRYRTATDMLLNDAMTGGGFRMFQTLVSMPKWSVVPALDMDGTDSSPAAKEMARFVTHVMNDMTDPWRRIVKRTAAYKYHGFFINEWTAKKILTGPYKGRIGFESVEARPPHTIHRWMLDPHGRVLGVEQRDPSNSNFIPISRSKCIYMCDDALSDSPEGLGLWRHLAESWNRAAEYYRIEGIGFDRDLRGIPVGRAPLAALDAQLEAEGLTGDAKTSKINDMLKGIVDFCTMKAKSNTTALIVDSATYLNQTETGESSSSAKMWDVGLLTANSSSLPDIGKAIERERYNRAMILGMETLLLGATSSGSRALSNDKSQNLYLTVNACNFDMAETFTRDFIGALWILNGFPEELRPSFQVEEAQFKDIVAVTQGMANMAMAGVQIDPEDPVVDAVRDTAGLPHAVNPGVSAPRGAISADDAAAKTKKPGTKPPRK